MVRTFELSTHVKVFTRSKGHNAVAAAAYRAGARLHCTRSNKTYRYTGRQGVLEAAIITPEGCPLPSREALWNAAEAAESRKNSRVAREWMFSLPVELSAEGRRAAVRRIARHLVVRHGVAVDYALHAPSKGCDPRNVHAHLLITTRRMTKDGALGEKTRELDDKVTGAQIVKDWRRITADALNAQLAAEIAQTKAPTPAAVHVEHRSFAARGITDRAPKRHHGKRRRWHRVKTLATLFHKAAKTVERTFGFVPNPCAAKPD